MPSSQNPSQSASRRQARELAFQFIFSRADLGAVPQLSDFESFCRSVGVEPSDYSWEVASGTLQNLPALDQRITALSKNWRIERMPRVDLAILRLAAFEITNRSDIPKTVAINEAIELAKKFGSEGSASFINGILDHFEKTK